MQKKYAKKVCKKSMQKKYAKKVCKKEKVISKIILRIQMYIFF